MISHTFSNHTYNLKEILEGGETGVNRSKKEKKKGVDRWRHGKLQPRFTSFIPHIACIYSVYQTASTHVNCQFDLVRHIQ